MERTEATKKIPEWLYTLKPGPYAREPEPQGAGSRDRQRLRESLGLPPRDADERERAYLARVRRWEQ